MKKQISLFFMFASCGFSLLKSNNKYYELMMENRHNILTDNSPTARSLPIHTTSNVTTPATLSTQRDHTLNTILSE